MGSGTLSSIKKAPINGGKIGFSVWLPNKKTGDQSPVLLYSVIANGSISASDPLGGFNSYSLNGSISISP